MGRRWIMLLVLFFARTTMAFQYGSVGSVAPFLVEDLGIDYAQLGMLVGVYQLPGIVLALPGGYLGKRFGEKRVVVIALGLMVAGGLGMVLGQSYAALMVARLVSGVGGIVLTVLLAKMTADWFAGQEIVTAMAILVMSWPFGIGLALVTLGPVSETWSWPAAMALPVAACAVALVLVAAVYRMPPLAGGESEAAGKWIDFSRWEVALVVLAGLVWMLFNVGFAVLPNFAPGFLASTGYTLAQANRLTSIVSWFLVVSLPVGGYLAERFGRPNLVLVTCLVGLGLATCLLPYWPYPLLLMIVLGLLYGPPPGIIMALPVQVLRPENRAPGLGLFSTCYYAGMPAMTALAGLARDLTGDPAAPLWVGGLSLFLSIGILGVFRALQRISAGGQGEAYMEVRGERRDCRR
jgi:MFS family permease